MKKSELVKLRKLVKEEIEKRKELNNYLENESVIKYLEMIGESTDKRDLEDIRGMLVEILRNFRVTETNGIYVCVCAYDEDDYEPPLFYRFAGRDDAPECRLYKDIESREKIETSWRHGPTIDDFERNHIVLNSCRSTYEKIRMDFFEECYRKGQNKAVQMILKKYPRI